MPCRTLILSDLHLGRPYGGALSAEAVRPLWQGADHLIINGDLAELHHPGYRAQAARQTLKFFELCENDDVRLTLLSGNHDAFLTDLRHLYLAQGQVFVTHGDALHPAIAPWSPRAGMIQQAHDHAQAQLAPENRNDLISRLQVTQHAALSEWSNMDPFEVHHPLREMLRRPWLAGTLLHYWLTLPRRAWQFAHEHAPRARFFILGHTHRRGIWRVKDLTIINTGCFGFPSRAMAVVLADNQLEIWPILRKAKHFELASKPSRVFELPTQTLDAEISGSTSPVHLDASGHIVAKPTSHFDLK